VAQRAFGVDGRHAAVIATRVFGGRVVGGFARGEIANPILLARRPVIDTVL
jgi:hypothetical protein